MKVTLDLNLKVLLRWILGVLLIWASISKLANLQDFYGSLLAYKLPLPDFFLRGTAMCLPWLELLCGLMLLAKVQLRSALTWAIILFSIFVLATGFAWARGLDISCGCLDLSLLGLGSESELVKVMKSVTFAFFRALLLTVGAIYLLRQETKAATATVR
ncbi:MAG: DoxX family protein [Pedosphaera sp.]|nr:DoxX family protein [Pedosphaera sp.]